MSLLDLKEKLTELLHLVYIVSDLQNMPTIIFRNLTTNRIVKTTISVFI